MRRKHEMKSMVFSFQFWWMAVPWVDTSFCLFPFPSSCGFFPGFRLWILYPVKLALFPILQTRFHNCLCLLARSSGFDFHNFFVFKKQKGTKKKKKASPRKKICTANWKVVFCVLFFCGWSVLVGGRKQKLFLDKLDLTHCFGLGYKAFCRDFLDFLSRIVSSGGCSVACVLSRSWLPLFCCWRRCCRCAQVAE